MGRASLILSLFMSYVLLDHTVANLSAPRRPVEVLKDPSFHLAQRETFARSLLSLIAKNDMKLRVMDEVANDLKRTALSLAQREEQTHGATALSSFDETFVVQLTKLGFPVNGARRAVSATQSQSLEMAYQWAVDHRCVKCFIEV